MIMPRNRKEWRAVQAKRDVFAEILALECHFIDANGARSPVKNETAKQTMLRAFRRLIAARGEPQVMRISEKAAKAFPDQESSPFIKGAKAWVGVCFDPDGHAAFALRWLAFDGDGSAADERRQVEDYIIRELEVLTTFSGLPPQEVAG